MDFQHVPGFAPSYYNRLRDELSWQEVKWGTGKTLPRLVYRSEMDEPVLVELVELVQVNLEKKVMGVWCNYYRNGKDYTPYHQDSYNQGVTVTLSFGATRKCYFKHKVTGQRKDFSLKDGDLFIFSDKINRLYKHTIPKEMKVKDGRISIVFFCRA